MQELASKLEINIFETIQGEGTWSGTPSFFIRLQGCDVRCFFCDEKNTWKHSEDQADGKPSSNALFINSESSNATYLTPQEILQRFQSMNPELKRVTITGGEPTEQDLTEFIELLIANGYTVAIETAGTGQHIDKVLALKSEYQNSANKQDKLWLTLSPKEIYSANGKISSPQIWQNCSELKFVVVNDKSIDYITQVISPSLKEANNNCPIFLTPDWFNFDENKSRVLELCKQNPQEYKLGLQTHKYLGLK